MVFFAINPMLLSRAFRISQPAVPHPQSAIAFVGAGGKTIRLMKEVPKGDAMDAAINVHGGGLVK